jgi:hypothetical protein
MDLLVDMLMEVKGGGIQIKSEVKPASLSTQEVVNETNRVNESNSHAAVINDEVDEHEDDLLPDSQNHDSKP